MVLELVDSHHLCTSYSHNVDIHHHPGDVCIWVYEYIRILWEFNGGNHEYHHTLGWTRVRGRGHEPRTAMSTHHFMVQGLNKYDRLLLGSHRSQLPVKSQRIYIYNERMKQVCYICLDTCRYACRCVCVCVCLYWSDEANVLHSDTCTCYSGCAQQNAYASESKTHAPAILKHTRQQSKRLHDQRIHDLNYC